MGCGDARLSKLISSKYNVKSFDLVASNPDVIECDISNVPLDDKSVSYVVFSLSLMGTNIRDFIYEANRILKDKGVLIIVEVASRFNGEFPKFVDKLKIMGFKMEFNEFSNEDYFTNSRFRKIKDITDREANTFPEIILNACIYKKR
ncbi:25S rRNA (adenine645-N1)-methyltransferase [Cichlidogyrus casuarinus]|uniref:Ribosomal RNA-processing protein 8 n=1 Tax=Cichlidogyrus casuarinus TaxID=1844966 RepID=A0ABD2PZD5_9PLAT